MHYGSAALLVGLSERTLARLSCIYLAEQRIHTNVSTIISILNQLSQFDEGLFMNNRRQLNQKMVIDIIGIALLLLISSIVALRIYFRMIGGGLGVTPDSLNYLQVAQNILAGNGFVAFDKPFVNEPPGYPIAIAIIALFRSGDVYRGAYWLQAILIVLNTILVGVATWVASRKKILAMAVGIALFLATGPILRIHATIWSEALFFTLFLSAMFIFSFYVLRHQWIFLILTGFAVGLAMIVRYAGITLIVPFLFYLLLINRQPILYRVRSTIIFSIPVISIFGLWIIRNLFLAKTALGRGITILPFSVDHIRDLVNTLFDFWIPVSSRLWFKAIPLLFIFGLLIVGCVYIYAKLRTGDPQIELALAWQIIGLVFIVTYILFMLFIINFVDFSIAFDYRMFAAVYIFLVIILISLIAMITDGVKQPLVWWFFLITILYLLFIKADKALTTVYDMQANGRGFTSQKWNNSATIKYVQKIPDKLEIYSNAADLIWFKTNKKAIMVPNEFSSFTGKPDPTYATRLEQTCRDLNSGSAIFVEFKMITRPSLPDAKKISQACGSLMAEPLADGIVLRSP
jgi:4-amino-4-deoxy-L-arabinose transferase-like glycosyltransferase